MIRICRPRLWSVWSVNRVALFVLGWVAALEGRSDTGSVRQIGQLKF